MKVSRITLCAPDVCTGCFACEGTCPVGAIKHIIDAGGFPYPQIDENKCIGCHSCEKHCPELKPVTKYKVDKSYAGWSLSDDVRQSSSSGGIFSELAMGIIKEGGIVVGAELGKDGIVTHVAINNAKELYRLRGSKYVQSIITVELFHAIKDALRENRKVLFTGTPCQVAAINSAFKNYPLLFTVDIICHGVPSPKLFKRVYDEVKARYKGFEAFNFRMLKKWGVGLNIDKKTEGGGENISLTAEDSYYLNAFDKGLLNRDCCYSCRYATIDRVGDITIGDFWGIGETKPFEYDVKKGCSIILVNSGKGQQLIDSIKGNLFLEDREVEETILGGNEQLLHPLERPKGRSTIYGDIETKNIKSVIRKYHLMPKKKSLISRAFGRVLRIIRKK